MLPSISLDVHEPHASLYSLRTGNKATMERSLTQVKQYLLRNSGAEKAAQECSQFSS